MISIIISDIDYIPATLYLFVKLVKQGLPSIFFKLEVSKEIFINGN